MACYACLLRSMASQIVDLFYITSHFHVTTIMKDVAKDECQQKIQELFPPSSSLGPQVEVCAKAKFDRCSKYGYPYFLLL